MTDCCSCTKMWLPLPCFRRMQSGKQTPLALRLPQKMRGTEACCSMLRALGEGVRSTG